MLGVAHEFVDRSILQSMLRPWTENPSSGRVLKHTMLSVVPLIVIEKGPDKVCDSRICSTAI